jgi:hypothetical protein
VSVPEREELVLPLRVLGTPQLPLFVKKYNTLKTKKAQLNLTGKEYAELLLDACLYSIGILRRECTKIELISQVPGKQYFAFRKTTRTSRPINRALFIEDDTVLTPLLEHFANANYGELSEQSTTSLLYTLAMAFCAANDVRKSGDKKTPATFFELFVAHIIARQFKAMPRKKVRVPAGEGHNAELPTDIVYDLGVGQVKFHVPVKLSTRERVIQAWAHQRVLAGLWGEGEFKGLLVVLAETKLDVNTLKVVEICLPLQWSVYQRYIARLDRVYYLDVPDKYLALATGHPRIDVKPLGAFFKEREALLVR